MCSRVKLVGLGAAASLAVCLFATSPAAANPVTVQAITWEYYQGGTAKEAPQVVETTDAFFQNLPTNTVTGTLAGATYTSTASMLNATTSDAGAFTFASFAALRAEASVDLATAMGSADAFATLSRYDVLFEVTGEPQYYFGTRTLEGPEGAPFVDGDVLAPGLYAFSYFNTFGLDAQLTVAPGESGFDEATVEFRFEFSPIPGPASAMLAAPAVLALRRRRR